MKAKKLILSCFSICIFLFSNTIKSQYITGVTYTPINPNPGDTIKIYGSTTYPWFGCPVTSKSTYSVPINNYMLKSFRCQGQLTTLCSIIDTFKIKISYSGLYYFHYMPGCDTSGICQKVPNYQYPSAVKTITIQVGAVGIKEHVNNNTAFLVYPNPFSNKLSIESLILNTAEKKKLVLTNTLGQIVYSTEFYQNSINIDLPQLQSGAYTAQLYVNGNFSYRTKLIKH